MALLFVHGVNTRNESPPDVVSEFLGRYLKGDHFPDGPEVVYSFWGDLAGRYRFNGRSRPRTRIAGQGSAGDQLLSTVADVDHLLPSNDSAASTPVPGRRLAGGMSSRAPEQGIRLKDVGRQEAVAYLMRSVERSLADRDQQRWDVLAALSRFGADDDAWRRIEAAASLEAELDVVTDYVRDQTGSEAYVAQGAGWLDRFRDSAEEGLRRAASAPALALSTGLGELRPKVDSLLEQFVGDVFTYLDTRDPEDVSPAKPPEFTGPDEVWSVLTEVAGPIPLQVMIDLLRCAELGPEDEPLVVLSHSMGGQVMYELFATFLPRVRDCLTKRGISFELPVVDLWCASASQVGLFEELSVFISSKKGSAEPAPFPGDFVRHWWNVWDLNDLLSFTADGIVEGVDDSEFFSGRGFIGAHSGYLERPSFYKRLADKIDEAVSKPSTN